MELIASNQCLHPSGFMGDNKPSLDVLISHPVNHRDALASPILCAH